MALADQYLAGCSFTFSVDESSHEKCLNNSSRAISVKEEAASQLASVSLASISHDVCVCFPTEVMKKLFENSKWVQKNMFKVQIMFMNSALLSLLS